MGTDRITAAQIKKIHVAARERGVDDDLLHEHIALLVKKDSIRLLTREEAAKVIDSLEGKPHSGKDAMTQKQKSWAGRTKAGRWMKNAWTGCVRNTRR